MAVMGVMGVAMGGESVVVMGGRTGGDSGVDAGNGGQEERARVLF